MPLLKIETISHFGEGGNQQLSQKKGRSNLPFFFFVTVRLFAGHSEIGQEAQQVRCSHRTVTVQGLLGRMPQ